MGYKVFAPGETLTAADVNTFLMRQAVIKCTSGTRPASPSAGWTIYEGDTANLLQYASAATGWQPPWNLPWGIVAYASSASAITVGTAATYDVLTATFTGLSGRRYRANCFAYFDNTGMTFETWYLSNGTPIGNASVGTGDVVICGSSPLFTATTSVSLVLQHRTVSGGASGDSYGPGSGGGKVWLSVEDVGPSGLPA